jgi:hypothetical protein
MRLETASPFAAALMMLFNTGIELAKRQQLAGKFLLLLVVRLEKRLDRLLQRTSRNLEQPVARLAPAGLEQ